MANVPPQSVIDARFRAKLDARATGATPIMVEAPAEATPEDLEARVREKLARHRLQAKEAAAKPAATPPAPEAKSAEDPEKPAEQKPAQQGGGEQHRRDNRR